MFRILALGAILAFLVFPGISRAADAPSKSAGPAIMLRLQSIDQLLIHGEYIAGLAGFDEQGKQLVGTVRAFAGDKGLEGVDIKKPFALYANLSQEITSSEVVLMVPIADKDSFLGLLKNRLALQINEGKDGLFSTEAPNNVGTIHFRFANGYVYGSYKNKEILAEAKLPKPADVVGKGDSVLALSLRIDRIPVEVRKFALGAAENFLAQGKEQPLPEETASIKAAKDKFIDSVSATLKAVLFEGEEVSLKIDVDGKKDELALELEMTAIKGSALAKDLADLKTKKSTAAGSLAASNTAMLIALNASVPASVKKLLGPAVDDLTKVGVNLLPLEAQVILEPLVKAALPTIKAGDLDTGWALLGPTAEGKFTVVNASKIAAGKAIEKAIKEAVTKLPAEIAGLIEVDADSAGDTKLHAVRIKDKLDDKARKLVGETDVWFAFRDDALFVALGPMAKEALKDALGKEPAAASLFKMEFSVGRLLPLAEVDNEKAAKKAAKEAFGDNLTGDTFTLSVDAGNSLRLRAAVKGKVIKFVAAMEKAKKENQLDK